MVKQFHPKTSFEVIKIIDKRNRHNSNFKYISCGFTSNNDRVASYNIALLEVRAFAQSTPSGMEVDHHSDEAEGLQLNQLKECYEF